VRGNLFLAPVAGYTDSAFRSICAEQGADLTFTALVSSEALVRGGLRSAHALLSRASDTGAANEEGYAVQLFGANAGVMADAAAMLAPCRPVMLDLNAGCPVPKVGRRGRARP
jgi:tRNA-dihydrouridine synthase